jgi:hypothetical protein
MQMDDWLVRLAWGVEAIASVLLDEIVRSGGN